MQLIFHTELTLEEYIKLGKDFPFPRPSRCLNPNCLIPIPPKKHGFYTRNAIKPDFVGRILIRRYYCKYCGMTFSYLPSFCLPYFQYSLEVIFTGLLCYFNFDCSVKMCLGMINSLGEKILWTRQHLKFYTVRFVANLKAITMGLRQLLRDVSFLDNEDMRKGAQKLLDTITAGFEEIQFFSQRFFAQCGRAFMAPLQIDLA